MRRGRYCLSISTRAARARGGGRGAWHERRDPLSGQAARLTESARQARGEGGALSAGRAPRGRLIAPPDGCLSLSSPAQHRPTKLQWLPKRRRRRMTTTSPILSMMRRMTRCVKRRPASIAGVCCGHGLSARPRLSGGRGDVQRPEQRRHRHQVPLRGRHRQQDAGRRLCGVRAWRQVRGPVQPGRQRRAGGGR